MQYNRVNFLESNSQNYMEAISLGNKRSLINSRNDYKLCINRDELIKYKYQ